MPVVALVRRGGCAWCRCGKAAWITGRWRGSCWQWRGRWRRMRLRSRRRLRRFPQVQGPARAVSVSPWWAVVLRMSLCRHRLRVAWQDGVLTSVIRAALTTWLMAPLPPAPMLCRIALVRLRPTRPLLRPPCREVPRDGPPGSSLGVASAAVCSAARPGRGGGVGGAAPGGWFAGSGGAGAARCGWSGDVGGGLVGW